MQQHTKWRIKTTTNTPKSFVLQQSSNIPRSSQVIQLKWSNKSTKHTSNEKIIKFYPIFWTKVMHVATASFGAWTPLESHRPVTTQRDEQQQGPGDTGLSHHLHLRIGHPIGGFGHFFGCFFWMFFSGWLFGRANSNLQSLRTSDESRRPADRHEDAMLFRWRNRRCLWALCPWPQFQKTMFSNIKPCFSLVNFQVKIIQPILIQNDSDIFCHFNTSPKWFISICHFLHWWVPSPNFCKERGKDGWSPSRCRPKRWPWSKTTCANWHQMMFWVEHKWIFGCTVGFRKKTKQPFAQFVFTAATHGVLFSPRHGYSLTKVVRSKRPTRCRRKAPPKVVQKLKYPGLQQLTSKGWKKMKKKWNWSICYDQLYEYQLPGIWVTLTSQVHSFWCVVDNFGCQQKNRKMGSKTHCFHVKNSIVDGWYCQPMAQLVHQLGQVAVALVVQVVGLNQHT